MTVTNFGVPVIVLDCGGDEKSCYDVVMKRTKLSGWVAEILLLGLLSMIE